MNRVRSTPLLSVVLLVCALGHAGCQPTLMPTPVAFDGGVDPLAETAPRERETTTRVFLVTDRKPTKHPTSPQRFYSNERDYGLRVGVATVDLGKGMTWDELRAESLEDRRPERIRVEFTGYEEYGALWTGVPPMNAESVEDQAVVDRFGEALRGVIAESGSNEIYIFVHGFNTKLVPNTRIAAELHHYLGRRGAMISYEWPSRGSLFKYEADKAAAQYSSRYFRLLLEYLAEETDAEVNIIAHSAGAPVAVSGVSQLCLMHHEEDRNTVRARYKIREMVLVAPDMDLGLFENAIHDELPSMPEQMTIYLSTRDKALSISAWIHGFAALGDALTQLTRTDLAFLDSHPDVDMIDVAGAEAHHGSWLGHSYFHSDPWVSSDVLMALRFGSSAPPQERGLERKEGEPIWFFPKDYPERVRAAAARLYGDAGGRGGAVSGVMPPGTIPGGKPE